nr:unnamed protein product [Digitaria exilis]
MDGPHFSSRASAGTGLASLVPVQIWWLEAERLLASGFDLEVDLSDVLWAFGYHVLGANEQEGNWKGSKSNRRAATLLCG